MVTLIVDKSIVNTISSRNVLQVCFQDCDALIISDQDESTSDGSENVGEVALEETGHSFIFHNFLPTIHCAPERKKILKLYTYCNTANPISGDWEGFQNPTTKIYIID